jgi:hypothetical protein
MTLNQKMNSNIRKDFVQTITLVASTAVPFWRTVLAVNQRKSLQRQLKLEFFK